MEALSGPLSIGGATEKQGGTKASSQATLPGRGWALGSGGTHKCLQSPSSGPSGRTGGDPVRRDGGELTGA